MALNMRLAGVPLLGEGSQMWPLRAGVDPVMQTMAVDPDGLRSLLQAVAEGNFVDLTWIDDQGRPHEVKRLLVVKEIPGPNPHVKAVLVADRRILWKQRWVLNRFNLRRRVGTKRRKRWRDALDFPQQLLLPEIQYRFFSLKNGQPWTALDVLEELMGQLEPGGFIVDGDVRSQIEGMPVENLNLDDPAPDALRRALKLLPGADVTVDPSGEARIYYTLTQREIEIIGTGEIGKSGQAGPEIIGGGHVELVSENLLRPEAVDVFFTMEVELRFDFLQDERVDVPLSETQDPGEPVRFLENVLPVPDFELELARGAGIAAQGTWITVQQALEAWTEPSGTLNGLTADILDRAFIPEMNLWEGLALLGSLDLDGVKADWGARVAALATHYRQTYRINARWIDNILSLRDYLVGTIDLTTGTRAPALAFTDHAIRASDKSMFLEGARGDDINYAFNVFGYPGINTEIRDTDKPAPAVVQILDGDQGIVRIDYRIDPYRLSDMVLPGTIQNGPTENVRRSANVPIAFNAVGRDGTIPRLAPGQRVAMILSAVPGSPNSKAQLYRIRVTPSDLRGVLPKEVLANPTPGFIQEVRVGPGVETARVRWKQDRATDIERIFGVGGELQDPRADLEDLVINDGGFAPAGIGASLPRIARAVAAVVYVRERKRVYGTRTANLNTGLRIEGALSNITHQLNQDGKLFTILGTDEDVSGIDLFTFLDASSRSIILRLVQP